MRIIIPAVPFAFAITFVFAATVVFALSSGDITYPVAELGNCESEFKCGVYCGDPAHKTECDAFIEKYDLDERSEKIKKIEFPIERLGNCGSREECEQYCSEPDNVEACIDFAEEHDLVGEDEREHVETDRKMARLIAAGETPGGCQSTDACIEYCMMDEHFDECIAFLEENDIMPERQLEYFKERRSFKFEGPGGCSGESECKEYCSVDENFETCVDFMEENGFMSSEEAQRLRQIGSFSGPGGCKMDECRDFCENPDNFQTCVDWAHENGMISDREYEIAKKTGGRGPGGCAGEECQDYCSSPGHQQECFEFACENGFMTEDQCEQGREMMQRSFTGPGGCQGPEECQRFCSDPANAEECRMFGQSVSGQGEFEREGGEFEQPAEIVGGPGGCRSEEECREYCASHPEECGFSPPPEPQQVEPESSATEEQPTTATEGGGTTQ